MTALTEFSYQNTGIRVLGTKWDPWFVGKDVCDVLGYSNPRDAIARYVDDEDKNTVALYDGNRGNPNIIIVNESGLYSLIFGSTLPAAKQFKRWVTHEVLPQIRKTGKYIPPKQKRGVGRPALPAKTYEISTGERMGLEGLRTMCIAFEHPKFNYESRFIDATAEKCVEYINSEIASGNRPRYDMYDDTERDETYWIVVDGKRMEMPS